MLKWFRIEFALWGTWLEWSDVSLNRSMNSERDRNMNLTKTWSIGIQIPRSQVPSAGIPSAGETEGGAAGPIWVECRESYPDYFLEIREFCESSRWSMILWMLKKKKFHFEFDRLEGDFVMLKWFRIEFALWKPDWSDQMILFWMDLWALQDQINMIDWNLNPPPANALRRNPFCWRSRAADLFRNTWILWIESLIHDYMDDFGMFWIWSIGRWFRSDVVISDRIRFVGTLIGVIRCFFESIEKHSERDLNL